MKISMGIGTLNEQSLHASLKAWLAQPEDKFEQKIGRYHIDIVRGPQLIEIQTKNFLKIRKKLTNLLENHSVLLVHPIPKTKWIIKKSKRGKLLSKRKSSKRGDLAHLFDELLYISDLVGHPNFRLQVLLTEQEEVWRDDGKGSWRRKHWSIADSKLLNVVESVTFNKPADFMGLMPASLQKPFTHKEMSKAMKVPIWVSTRMSYCLRKMGTLSIVGKRGRTLLLAPYSADKISAA
jgi:hypothetical protein